MGIVWITSILRGFECSVRDGLWAEKILMPFLYFYVHCIFIIGNGLRVKLIKISTYCLKKWTSVLTANWHLLDSWSLSLSLLMVFTVSALQCDDKPIQDISIVLRIPKPPVFLKGESFLNFYNNIFFMSNDCILFVLPVILDIIESSPETILNEV